MRIPLYQVDAFTDRRFHGNPAAICPLDHWLPDSVLQAIATENNLSETAFYVRGNGASASGGSGPAASGGDKQAASGGDKQAASGGDKQAACGGLHVDLRWFTPAVEVDLCGHATLATALVILDIRKEISADLVEFQTKSGTLVVHRDGDRFAMDFPARPAAPCNGLAERADIAAALGAAPSEVLAARDYLCVFPSEADVLALKPDMAKLAALGRFGMIVTAPGSNCDFVSRFFAPAKGVPEDPVTGSSHCTLIPYWAKRLGKSPMHARQVSARGGELWCEMRGDRVRMSGHGVLYLEGQIEVDIAGVAAR